MQQVSGLPLREKTIPSGQAKEKRAICPNPFLRAGRTAYTNGLEQAFICNPLPEEGTRGKRYKIEILQLGEGKPIPRFSADLLFMGKALKITSMERVGWESRPHAASQPIGYKAARIILKKAILLAQHFGAQTIYIEPPNRRLFAYFLSLGFQEIPNSTVMQLKVPEKQ